MAKKNRTTPTEAATETAIAAPPPPTEAVLDWLLRGHAEADIVGALRVKYPTDDPATILSRVQERREADGNPNRDALRGWALNAYRDLYRRCLEIGDFDGARKMLGDLAKIAGL